MNVLAMKSYTCDKCDKQYSRKYDMLRHVRKAHPEDDEEEGNTVSHPPSKRRRLQEDDSRDSSDTESRSSLESEGSRDDESESEDEDETSGDETGDETSDAEGDQDEDGDESHEGDETSSELEDNATFREWYDLALQETRDMRKEKYEKYVARNMDEDQAGEKAYEKSLWAIKRAFFDYYRTFLRNEYHLVDHITHSMITDELGDRIMGREGIPIDKAINSILAKHKGKFDALFHYDPDDQDEDDDEADGNAEENDSEERSNNLYHYTHYYR